MSALVVKPRWRIGDYVSGSHERTGWKATLEDAAKVLHLRSVWECDHYHKRESAAQECGDREQAHRARHRPYPAPAVPLNDPMRNRRVDLTGLNKQAYREL